MWLLFLRSPCFLTGDSKGLDPEGRKGGEEQRTKKGRGNNKQEKTYEEKN